MEWYQSFWLGLTQGVTEFIPVSSSGHLEVMQQILGGRSADFHLFLEFINLGTLLALLIFYRKRIWQIVVDIFANHNVRLAVNVIITTIPAVIAGLLLSDIIESSWFFSNMIVIACAMALIGIAMLAIDRLPKMSKLKSENELTKPRALIIGLAQCVALIPGTSRSGSTIVAGRLTGLDSKSAADYSFLASIPIMIGVMAKSLISSSSREYISANLSMLALSNVVAFVTGLIAIYFVMKYLRKKNSLKPFGIYRIVLALIIIVFELLK
jgi:undecaprenyl-diphosphatase